jgi:predicted dehydrogenase
MGKIKAGIIGCGNISEIYFSNGKALFEGLEVVACADLDLERVKAKAEKHGVIGYSVEELLADPQIQLVINLTIPKVHAKVNLQALHEGKNVYV